MSYCPKCKNYKTSDEICEDCGAPLLKEHTKICSNCGAQNRIDLEKCIKCSYPFDLESDFKKAKVSESEKIATQTNQTESASYQFKTLLGYGKFISGFGWFVVLIGIIAIIVGLASGEEAGFGIAGGALILIILGISMVISGQVISCFVSIEKNTRATYKLLKEKH